MRTVITILIALLSSCSQVAKTPGIIPEDRFTEYYADVLILRQEGALSGADSNMIASRIDSLNRSYSVTREQVDATLDQYKEDLPRWRSFYGLVVKRLEKLQRPDTTANRRAPR